MSGDPQSYMPVSAAVYKEWEEARCLVCLEPPHNAVHFECSSQKGCEYFICNTSYRLSNCFDRLLKASSQSQGGGYNQQIRCLICGEPIRRWRREKNAQSFMDAKIRSCSLESCSFEGTYQELRKHVWMVHPLACPSEVEPDEKIAWQEIENLWELLCLVGSLIHDAYDAPDDQITEKAKVLKLDDPHVETDSKVIWLRRREEGTSTLNDSRKFTIAEVHGRVAIRIEEGVQITLSRGSIAGIAMTIVVAELAGTHGLSETNQFTGQTVEFFGYVRLYMARELLFNIW